MTHPKHPAAAKTGPPPLSELLPAMPPGWQHMPPSIRDAHTLLDEHAALTETERNTLTPDDVDNWLAAMMVTRMPVPLARFMPPLGRLDCKTVVAATKRALPEFRITPRAWKAFCRRQHEFGAVIAVTIAVHEILDHPGPVPEDLPDKLLKRLSTHEGMTAFFKTRESTRQQP